MDYASYPGTRELVRFLWRKASSPPTWYAADRAMAGRGFVDPAVFAVLRWLASQGWVKALPSDGPMTTYALTAAGIEAARAMGWLDELDR